MNYGQLSCDVSNLLTKANHKFKRIFLIKGDDKNLFLHDIRSKVQHVLCSCVILHLLFRPFHLTISKLKQFLKINKCILLLRALSSKYYLSNIILMLQVDLKCVLK